MQGCFQITSLKDTVLSIEGTPHNISVADLVAAYPTQFWIVEPSGYYPDLYTTWEGDAPAGTFILTTGQTELVAGSHPPRLI